MPNIYVGSTPITDLKLGNAQVESVYLGSTLIWQSGPPSTDFVFNVQTDMAGTASQTVGISATDQFQLPLISAGTYNFNVDWGDGNDDDITVWNDLATLHTYSVPGLYTITITGQIEGWRHNNAGDHIKVKDVSSWGPLTIAGDATGAFYGCVNMTFSGSDELAFDPTGITSLRDCFHLCGSLVDPNIGSWDVSAVTTFTNMFNSSSVFNADLNLWNVSSALTMLGMFRECTAFNGDISSWDVSSVTNFSIMFWQCTAFNGDISSWDVSSGTNFSTMLRDCPAFNPDISSWDVSAGQNFSQMFRGSSAFNSDISSWAVSSGTNFNSMLRDCPAFDRSLGSWDVSSGTDFDGFMEGSQLSTANYDATLIGWEQLTLQNGQNCHFGSSQYTAGGAAEQARDDIVANFGWTITDGGPAP